MVIESDFDSEASALTVNFNGLRKQKRAVKEGIPPTNQNLWGSSGPDSSPIRRSNQSEKTLKYCHPSLPGSPRSVSSRYREAPVCAVDGESAT